MIKQGVVIKIPWNDTVVPYIITRVQEHQVEITAVDGIIPYHGKVDTITKKTAAILLQEQTFQWLPKA